MDNTKHNGLSPRAVRHAVREYLANDLGITKAYVDQVIGQTIAARNIDGIIQTEIQKYFHKGPSGFKADEIVQERIASVVDGHVAAMMDSGLRKTLKATVDEHIRQMTDGPAVQRLETACTDRSCAVYLSTKTILDAFQNALHYKLAWTEPRNEGLMWGIRAKPETTYATWLADDIADVFGLRLDDFNKTPLRVCNDTVHIPPSVTEQIIKHLFPWLGAYARSFQFANGVLFVYEDDAAPKQADNPPAKQPDTDSDALLAAVQEIAKNPIAFDAWPEAAKTLYKLVRAHIPTEAQTANSRNERTEPKHA